jgi:hypothetical protein
MTDFHIWKKRENALPEAVCVDGKAFSIHADFRNRFEMFGNFVRS